MKTLLTLAAFALSATVVVGAPVSPTTPDDLPNIMKANGWKQGESLLRYWFNSEGGVEKKTIKMDWALSFSRLRAVYDRILDEKIYVNAAAKEEMARRLGVNQSFEIYCNSRAYEGRALEACKEFDGLDVSLNRCTLRVVAYGTVELKNKKRLVKVQSVGVYIYDKFDFEGTQFLGYWNKQTMYAGCNTLKGTLFTNKSFRDYRSKYKKGADFEVVSDVKVTRLKTPIEFYLP